MSKPSASTSIVPTMASFASTDFDAIDHKNSIDETTRIRYQLNHAIHHIEQHYADDPKNLTTLRAHFVAAERAAATRFGKQTVVGSSSTLKRKSSVGDLEISDDEDKSLSEKKAKGSKKPKVSDDEVKREKNMNGMNVFVNMISTKLNDEGYGGADTFSEGIHRWSRLSPGQKNMYQLKAGPINLHHKQFREEVEGDASIKSEDTNKELNKRWQLLGVEGQGRTRSSRSLKRRTP